MRVQQRRHDRVNIFLDGEYAFALQSILAAGLRVGQELSDAEISDLQRQDATERAYERALNLLSYRPRSVQEVQRYLEKREVDPESARQVLARLERAGLLSDESFAEYWVENREASRPRGKWALRAELRDKGIAPELIEEAVQEVDEEASALAVAERKAAQLAGLDEMTFRRRLLGFLQRRGFGYEVSQKITSRLWKAAQHGEDLDAE